MWCKELTHWKRLWCWEGLGAGGEGDDRGWDGWMASPTQWTWVWVNSGSWWWTWRPGVLQFTGSQRVGHDSTELNWTEYISDISMYQVFFFFLLLSFLLLSFLLSFHSIHSMHFHSVFIHSPDDVNFCYFLVLMIMTENKFSINIHIESFV